MALFGLFQGKGEEYYKKIMEDVIYALQFNARRKSLTKEKLYELKKRVGETHQMSNTNAENSFNEGVKKGFRKICEMCSTALNQIEEVERRWNKLKEVG